MRNSHTKSRKSLAGGIAAVCAMSMMTIVSTSVGSSMTASAAGCLPKTGPLQLMMLGDSLTAGGYGDGDPQGPDLTKRFRDSYRYDLYRQLKSAGLPPFAFVGHRGQKVSYGTDYSGDLPTGSNETEFAHSGVGFISTEEVLAQFDAFLAGPDNGHKVDPDLVVVNLGNNIKTKPVPYQELINKIQSRLPNAVLVLGTMPLVKPELSNPVVPERAELMQIILGIANASPTDNIFGVDVNAKLRSGPTQIVEADFAPNDNVHMNISGGNKFAAALGPDVIAAVKVAASLRCATPSAVVPGAKPAATKAPAATAAPAPAATAAKPQATPAKKVAKKKKK